MEVFVDVGVKHLHIDGVFRDADFERVVVFEDAVGSAAVGGAYLGDFDFGDGFDGAGHGDEVAKADGGFGEGAVGGAAGRGDAEEWSDGGGTRWFGVGGC